MSTRVYTLWASMKGDEPAPWMIAAEDESSWEGDPERCEAVFKTARELADRNGWDVREVTLAVDWDAVAAAFEATELAAGVEATRPAAAKAQSAA